MATQRGLYKASVEAWDARSRMSPSRRGWSPDAVPGRLRAEVEPFEEAGLLDPAMLDGFQAEVAARVEALFAPVFEEHRDAVGREVAESVFGHTAYANRLDRQLATGAAAVAELVMEELVWLAGHDLVRRLAGVRRRLDPAVPAGATLDAGPAAGGGP